MYRVKDIKKQQQKCIEKYKRLCILRDLFVRTNSGKLYGITLIKCLY